MNRRRRGFTLIELLVVIAIIAILAAMLFPVFARARESARKIQCLSSVKNIAMAFQMYFVDYDRYMPSEHRQEVIQWFEDNVGCDNSGINPFLEVPLILDEYVRNRDVWRCPSARVQSGATWIRPTTPGWFEWTQQHYQDQDVCCWGFCQDNYPPGWGGAVTDTSKQGQATSEGRNVAEGAFEQGIGTLDYNYRDIKIGSFRDPSKQVVCLDGGLVMWGKILHDVYPDICAIDRIGIGGCTREDAWGAWTDCPWSRECSPLSIGWFFDPNLRKHMARHLGGSNVGFVDGHAQWVNSEALMAGAERPNQPEQGALYYGLAWCRNPGDPECTCQFQQWPQP